MKIKKIIKVGLLLSLRAPKILQIRFYLEFKRALHVHIQGVQ